MQRGMTNMRHVKVGIGNKKNKNNMLIIFLRLNVYQTSGRNLYNKGVGSKEEGLGFSDRGRI